MRFAEPQWLWLLCLVPTVLVAGLVAHARRRRALLRFAGGVEAVARSAREVSIHRRVVKLLLTCAALTAIPLALARPQWGSRLETITRRGADVVVALDTSLSMSAEDLAPSRLEQAKHAIAALLERIPGERVSLVTFAGEAHLACPLTVDHGAALLFLEAADLDAVPVGGTAVGAALETALTAFGDADQAREERGRAILLFTDGENTVGEVDATLDRLEERGIAVYAVGCGTTRGAPIPLRDENGNLTGYKKDREGKVVTTRLDQTVLDHVAFETGGRSWQATTSEAEIDELGQMLSKLAQGDLGSEVRARYEERFQLPLLFALAALVGETLTGDRRRAARGGRTAAREVA